MDGCAGTARRRGDSAYRGCLRGFRQTRKIMKNPTRFQPGQSGSPSTMWRKGESGNPAGTPRARREFERAFFAAVCDEETLNEAVGALKKAIREGQAWALQLYLSKVLPPEAINVRVSRGDNDERSFDYSRLSDAEFEE